MKGTVALPLAAATLGAGASGSAVAQEAGSTMWEHTLGHRPDATFHSVAAAASGERYLFAGDQAHPSNGEPTEILALVSENSDVLLLQEDPDPRPNPSGFRDAVAVGDGTYYAVGRAADEDGSYPLVARIEPSPEEGFVFHWRDVADRPGVIQGAAATPDRGLIAVGTERNQETGLTEGRVVKYDGGGEVQWTETVSPDGVAVELTDVVLHESGTVGFCGEGDIVDGGRQALAGTVEPGGENLTSGAVESPDSHPETVFNGMAAVPDGGDGHWIHAGVAYDDLDRPSAYVVITEADGTPLRYHLPGPDDVRSGYNDILMDDERGWTIASGFVNAEGHRDAWLSVIDESSTPVLDVQRGGEGDDAFTSAAVGNDLVISGQAQSSDVTDAWALAVTSGERDDTTESGQNDDEPAEEGGQNDGGDPVESPQAQQRGFISNDGGDPEFLSDAFNLTTIGFLLSVVGIAHQMLKGR